MFGVFSTVGAWLARRFAAWGLGIAFLGPLGPILGGIASAIGAAVSALFEIIAALAKSPEGRVVLALIAAALGFLYLRFHYIEEGRALAQVAAYSRGVAHGKGLVKCASQRR